MRKIHPRQGRAERLTRTLVVLYSYDHVITLDNEVKYVWRRRISGASVLFMMNRYMMLLASLASIIHLVPRFGGNVDSAASNLVVGRDKVSGSCPGCVVSC